MSARVARFKDEKGELTFSLTKAVDRELLPVMFILIPGVLCFLLQGRTLGRTIEGDMLAYKLAAIGLLAGIISGMWRCTVLTNLALRFCPPEKAEVELAQFRRNRKAVLVGYVIASIVFAVSVGGLANRMIPAGKTKMERAVIASMPGHGGKGGAFWLWLHMDTRQHGERLSVSGAEYRNFRTLDIVEVHSRRGIFGYDYVTDIVRVGSQRVGSQP